MEMEKKTATTSRLSTWLTRLRKGVITLGIVAYLVYFSTLAVGCFNGERSFEKALHQRSLDRLKEIRK